MREAGFYPTAPGSTDTVLSVPMQGSMVPYGSGYVESSSKLVTGCSGETFVVIVQV